MTVYYVDNVLIFVLNSLTPQAVCIFKALLFLPQLWLDEYFREPYSISSLSVDDIDVTYRNYNKEFRLSSKYREKKRLAI